MKLHSLHEIDNTEGTVQLHDVLNGGQLILHPAPNPNDPNEYVHRLMPLRQILMASTAPCDGRAGRSTSASLAYALSPS